MSAELVRLTGLGIFWKNKDDSRSPRKYIDGIHFLKTSLDELSILLHRIQIAIVSRDHVWEHINGEFDWTRDIGMSPSLY